MNNYNRIHQMETDDMVEEIHNNRETIKELEQQLQAYKDREDKAIYLINHCAYQENKYSETIEYKNTAFGKELLQIFNKEER